MCVLHVCWSLVRSEEGVRPLAAGVTDRCECCELTLGPQEEQPALFTAEQTPPPYFSLKSVLLLFWARIWLQVPAFCPLGKLL